VHLNFFFCFACQHLGFLFLEIEENTGIFTFLYFFKNIPNKPGVVAGGLRAQGQPGLHSEILSQKTKIKNKNAPNKTQEYLKERKHITGKIQMTIKVLKLQRYLKYAKFHGIGNQKLIQDYISQPSLHLPGTI
jgi:hypothetical protein